MLSAACDTASTFASDICAASSTNRTSAMPAASGRAQNQPVAPPTWQPLPSPSMKSGFLVVS